MDSYKERYEKFSSYVASLKGDEKGEAQVFLDRLFQAFGHEGYKEAGATLEHRVRTGKGTKFADMFWKDRVLIEMKKRGVDLSKHYKQAFNYWVNLTPHRPKYVVLCNFDEFQIYDFDLQVNEPVDIVQIDRLFSRHAALNFLSIEKKPPVFKNNLVDVTKDAANKAAQVYNSLVKRGEDPKACQRFVLQCIFCLFAEDYNLLPSGIFTELLADCRLKSNCFEMIGALFRQMDSSKPARGGMFTKVPYFNGGLFSKIDPVDMNGKEIDLLIEAAREDWSKVKPEIFGTLFQCSMGKEERHTYGAHFTSEADIYKIVMPTIVNPWQDLVSKATTLKSLQSLLLKASKFRVLDPACGSGNFLYIAYRELKRIELEIIDKIYENFSAKALAGKVLMQRVGTKQFFGIDNNPFAVELAKITLIFAKEISALDQASIYRKRRIQLPDLFEKTLPLDNIDDNFKCADALFVDWPCADIIIGNPPYQSKNKMHKEFSSAYMKDLRTTYPKISGRADYCVYWFRKAHDNLKPNGRAGLVGTNTIRETYSRESGLDYIVNNCGTITDAVSSQVWSGDAQVHVSIVNWIKGKDDSLKQLKVQIGDSVDSPWQHYELHNINSSLSPSVDISRARKIVSNNKSKTCYQGQTHGHKGFLLQKSAAQVLLKDVKNKNIIHPYMTINDMLSTFPPRPKRFSIDFQKMDLVEASTYKEAFLAVKENVLPEIELKAKKERELSGSLTGPRQSHLSHWWKFWRPRGEMISKISRLSRYVSCGQVTKRPIFEFISKTIRPNAALMVFAFEDDYSFGVLQSSFHWVWFVKRCSTLTERFRYTSTTVYDTFPWPQHPSLAQVLKIANLSKELRSLRSSIMIKNQLTYRELYRTLELPGKNPLKDAHSDLDEAVRSAYGFQKKVDSLQQLLDLNLYLYKAEVDGNDVNGPGLPKEFKNIKELVSDDFIKYDF